jgi:hypothetical protein
MKPHDEKCVVISQSMYFPWVGLLEQIRLSDVFVYYDDVQFTRGFYNRVQVKTSRGPQWLTVPLRDQHRGQHIDQVVIDERIDWRSRHREILRRAYDTSSFRDEMLSLVDRVFEKPAETLADVSRASLMELAAYFGLVDERVFLCSTSLAIGGASSKRLHDIVLALKGTTYITGHGALNYLNHQLFEQSGIAVRYMRYRGTFYPQLHGEFTPYVTALDLVANCGRDGIRFIHSETVDWKEFSRDRNEQS